MKKISLFLIFVFYTNKLLSATYSNDLEKIKQFVYESLEKTRELGLSSPYRYNVLSYEWPGRVTKNNSSYSDYREAFFYLFFHCDQYFQTERLIKEKKDCQDFLLKYSTSDSITHLQYCERNREKITRLEKCISNYNQKCFLIQSILHDTFADISIRFSILYTTWSSQLCSHDLFFQKSLLAYDEGNNISFIENVEKLIETGKVKEVLKKHKKEEYSYYYKLGKNYNDTGLHEKAIIALNEAINKNPNKKGLYLERALAYFELGQFDQAFDDFLISSYKSTPIKNDSLEFATGLIKGASVGGIQGLSEFIPSMLSSLRGLSHGLWAFVSTPVEFSKEMKESLYQCVEFLKKNTSKELLEKFIPELQDLTMHWGELSESNKGEKIGYIIGKYGIDILATTGSIEALKTYRNLKKANAIFTLERGSKFPNSQIMLKKASERWAAREKILKSKNIKIEWNKQGKHIIGHKNYIKGRSILEHEKPEMLLTKYAGKGQKIRGKPGQAGYQEAVDFGEKIGICVNEETGKQLATTRGIIHYSKKGTHIVPAPPKLPIGKK